MNTGQHYLVVPDDPRRPMELEHPKSCPQHGHLELYRHEDGTVACPIEELARREEGPERFFRRPGEHPPLFGKATSLVGPGRWPIQYWPDGRLRLTRTYPQPQTEDA